MAQQNPSVPIIPEPAHASRGNGTLSLAHGLYFDRTDADPEARSVERYLQGLLERTHNAGII
ncbi:MAG TPA: hypothetical protein VHN81_00635, partial [Edaphobacter sp.]|nr:hypothetical protein [Edaphobacter sp.]